VGSLNIRAFVHFGNSPPCECSCVVAGGYVGFCHAAFTIQ